MSAGDPVAEALARVLGPSGPQLTCEECFDRLDRYVEIAVAGGDAEGRVPGMRAHLEGCSACREEGESLAALLADDAGGSEPR
jgi:hypothetical protein